jgi:hypothetical protein
VKATVGQVKEKEYWISAVNQIIYQLKFYPKEGEE